jgi:hypothetical protein
MGCFGVALESLHSRKLTVAFAIGKLLQHLKNSLSSYSQDEVLRLCSVDNFTVKMVANGAHDEVGWDVIGIDMISPRMSIEINQISPTSDVIEDRGDCIDVVVTRHSPFCCAKHAANDESKNDFSLCFALGLLIRFVFSDGSSLDSSPNSQENPQETQNHQNCMTHFLRSLSISPSSMIMNTDDVSEPPRPTKLMCPPSQYGQKSISGLGMPSPVAVLVRDLLACQQVNGIVVSETITLDAAIHDLHMLLARPDQFLLGANQQLLTATNMYGRASLHPKNSLEHSLEGV